MTRGYRYVIRVAGPIMNRWSRMTVTGLEHLPPTGPVIVAGDHDSYWDTLAIAVAAGPVRQIRALAKSTLFEKPLIGPLMNEMGHVPIVRGASNAEIMKLASDLLAQGACLGIFPEATRSLGQVLRARSGVGWLARSVPDATVVGVRTNGSTDVVRFPTRPRVSVEFFRPRDGQLQPDEKPLAFAKRLLAELREGAPPEIPGRKRTAAKYRARAAEPPRPPRNG